MIGDRPTDCGLRHRVTRRQAFGGRRRITLGWLLRLSLPAAFLASAPLDALTVRGVQSAALDQPQLHMLLRRTQAGQPLTDVFGLGLFNLRPSFLDTGASGIVLSQDTVDLLAVALEPGVTVREFGIGGDVLFGLAETLFASLAPTSLVVNISDPADYDQDFGPARMQVGSPVDIVGMPVIDGRVIVMDPRPVNRFITEGVLDTMRTYLYAPGTPFDPANADTAPGIPPSALEVALSFADFSSAVTVEPPGSPLPSLAANPFIGSDPTAGPMPGDPPGVTIALGARQSTGNFLLDTGAASTFISEGQAANVNVRYRPGTQGTPLPVLEFIDSGVEVPNQYRLPVSGVGGTVTAAGFVLDSLTLQSIGGEPIVFEGAPVTVLDIGTDTLTLDGVFGMNYLVGSAFFDGVTIGPFALGAFDFVVYDDPNARLGFRAGAIAVTVRFDLQAGLNIVSNPLQLDPAVSSYALGALIGADLVRVSRLDAGGRFQTTTFTGGVPSGPDFALRAGEGYLVQVNAPANLDLAGLAGPVETDLAAGINLVGFHQTPASFSAHDLLALIGDATVVRSVARLDPLSGRYQTAVRSDAGIAGPDFPISPGEGYLVSMRQAVGGLAVPRLITVAVGP